MRRFNIFLLMATLLFSGCYKDKGNYYYQKLETLTIAIPFESYQVGIGARLQINPEIITSIPDTALTWQWEVGNYSETVNNYYTFLKFAEGKNLDHVFTLYEDMPAPGNYRVRLHAKQTSNGRDFYSSPITINMVSDYAGLMVLHGNDLQSDIGLLKASEFLVSQGTIPTSLNAALYSSVNGEKIDGKGVSVIQSYTEFLSDASRATVVALTDKGAAWASYADFSKGGDWNSMFKPGISKGKPEFYNTQGQNVYAVDDGRLFPRSNGEFAVFPIASTAVAAYKAGSRYFEVSGRVQGFFFDKTTRGFVETSNNVGFVTFSSNAGDYFKQISTAGIFNMASMNADLLYLDKGGVAGHYMAVMKEDNGNKFLAELHWGASSDAGIPQARYDMSVLPDIAGAKFFSFGDNQGTMCYYGTSTKVFRFTALPGNENLSGRYNQLQLENGTPVNFEGEITMMKVLKPMINNFGSLRVNYHNYNKILLVGVYKNGQGTLYSLKINETTGDVVSYNTYTGFDKIFDANLKGI